MAYVADRSCMVIARSRYGWRVVIVSKVRRRSRVTPRTRIESATGLGLRLGLRRLKNQVFYQVAGSRHQSATDFRNHRRCRGRRCWKRKLFANDKRKSHNRTTHEDSTIAEVVAQYLAREPQWLPFIVACNVGTLWETNISSNARLYCSDIECPSGERFQSRSHFPEA